ncbi:hypothetical protein [Puniceibacterium confluentis]|uniref:hypothetical protein n=1 Tax=Puniceibacterium confluentis TaxID=1958944 RepID=UPI0011B826F2|nr:hypothetical protein [Puniceibacterium confluentis]
MVSSSKILTVSYGTFSCTLEGFDDSFDTMKAIAEYFRDLAQDDRYFGAEPPTPDAEMLARIAEREIERRVEARMENGSYVLRPSLGAPRAEPAPRQEPAAARPEAEAQPAPQAAAMQPQEPAPVAAEAPPAPVTPAPVADADDPLAAEPEMATEADDAAAEADSAATEADSADEAESDVADSDLDDRDEDDAEVMMPASAPVATEANSVAAKLQRIRAVVSASRGSTPAAYSEDEHADVIAASAEEPEASLVDVTLQDGDDEDDGFDSAAISTFMGSLGSPDEDESDLAEASPVVTDDAEQDVEDEDLDDLDLSDFALPADDSEETDEADTEVAAVARAAEDETDSQDDGDNLFDDTLSSDAAFEDDLGLDEAAFDTPDADEAHSAIDDVAEEQAPAPVAETPASHPVRARVVRVKRVDYNAAVAAGTLKETPAVQTPASSLTAEQEADLARELAEVAGELNQDFDDGDDWDLAAAPRQTSTTLSDDIDAEDDDWDAPEAEAAAYSTAEVADSDPEVDVLKDDADEVWDTADHSLVASGDAGLLPDPAAPDAPRDVSHSELGMDDEWDDDTENDAAPLAASRDETPEGEDSVDAAVERMARDGIRKAVKMSSPARVMLTENKIEEDDTSVERILDETNTQLQEPEGNRRRSAIAHLRAAVAATRADRILGRKKDTEKEAEPYRADLATVVRPRRPETPAAARSERPAELKPAPLKLVAEQRVDARPTQAEANETVRPRRVIRDDTAPDLLDLDEAAGGFAEFAEDMGATELPELLEAAAAYMSFVEGRDQFSRPQLMTRVRAVESEESSREDRLRSFGQLLREGKIEKTRGGRFTASERISFKPGARAAG